MSSASTIRCRIRRSFRKCWPRLLRTGGRPRGAPRPRGRSITPSTAEDHDREIVTPRHTARMRIEHGYDLVENLRGWPPPVAADGLEDAVFTEPLPGLVASVAHAVGEEDEQVSLA